MDELPLPFIYFYSAIQSFKSSYIHVNYSKLDQCYILKAGIVLYYHYVQV